MILIVDDFKSFLISSLRSEVCFLEPHTPTIQLSAYRTIHICANEFGLGKADLVNLRCFIVTKFIEVSFNKIPYLSLFKRGVCQLVVLSDY